MKPYITGLFLILLVAVVNAQPPHGLHWAVDGNSYYESDAGTINKVQLPSFTKAVVVTTQQLTPANASEPLSVRNFFFSDDGKKVLIYTNSKKVWRYDTRGDYW